jgi:diguanylate cyclase (GGDEF)-like protein
MKAVLPHVGICTYGKPLGKEIASSLSNHPFEVVELTDLESATKKHESRPLDMVGLVLPENPKDEAAQARERFPKIPVLVVSKTGRELGNVPRTGDAETRLDELKEKTALQEICWWVANELSRPLELKELSSAQLRPVLVELDGEGKLKPDPTLRSRWFFPGACPADGQPFVECLVPEDQEMFMRELRSLTPESRFSVFPIRIHDNSSPACVVEAGLRRADEKNYLMVLQPMVHELKSTWEQVATHDPLTKLFNRWGMTRILEELQAPEENGAVPHFLVYFDLDKFKTINDVVGRVRADDVLVQVGKLVEKFFPAPNLASRFMGDEFLVITRNLSVQEVKVQVEKVMAGVKEIPVPGFSADFHPSISAGICELLPERQDVALTRVEEALRRAKESGRGIMVVRKDQSLGRTDAQIMMEGLNRGQFNPWIQPIVGRDGKTVEFYEALARFKEGEQWVSPVRFLRLRGTQGLVSWLDRSIFIQVLNLLFERPKLKLSVNLSAESFALAPFPGCFLRLARDAAVEMDRILVEISEEVMKLPKDLVMNRIGRMKEVGIEVLLDDFGSGLSPLAYLTDFPFSMVKLDGNITQGVEKDTGKFNFVKSIVEIAHVRGMKTVAEYVETQPQMEKLIEAGVEFFQGHLFGMAQSPEKYLGERKVGAGAA